MDAAKKTTPQSRLSTAGRHRSPSPQTSPATQEAWVQEYTGRVLQAWFHQPTALGLAWTYANWIRRDLAQCYAHPLKKAFIEMTYRQR